MALKKTFTIKTDIPIISSKLSFERLGEAIEAGKDILTKMRCAGIIDQESFLKGMDQWETLEITRFDDSQSILSNTYMKLNYPKNNP